MKRYDILIVAFMVACDAGGTISLVPDALEADESAVAAEIAPEAGGTELPLVDSGHDSQDQGPQVLPSPYIPAKTIRIEGAGRDGSNIAVALIARDFPEIYGIALRVEWDPALLQVVDVSIAPLFGTDGVYRFAEVRPGSLTIGMAHAMFNKLTALTGDKTIATLKFKPLSSAPASLTFFEPRCLWVADRLEKVEQVTYLGATVQP